MADWIQWNHCQETVVEISRWQYNTLASEAGQATERFIRRGASPKAPNAHPRHGQARYPVNMNDHL